MEALEFLRKYRWICDSVESCAACPLSQASYDSACDFEYLAKRAPETLVRRIETWSKEHPIITNGQKFKEVFGFVPSGCQTFYFVEPNSSYSKTINWQDPYKEPKHD